jgi:cell division protein FtsI/penicillin-binding protein 2
MMLVRDFGFTQPTGIEFPGEARGKLMKEKDLNEIEFATLLFGQGITCNLLQITYAYQAIANEGVLNKPYIVSLIKQKNRITHHFRPLRVRRIIDEDVARKATEILCSVVEEGSGIEAKIDGVKVAGKTGTSQKVIDGRYSRNQVITTFIGFFPAGDPEYLIALMLDEPQKGLWASTITTPVFKRIAQSIRQITSSQYAAK